MSSTSALISGVGMSKEVDAASAGREAAEMAIAPLAGAPPALVVGFTTPRYDLPQLLASIRSVTGDAPLIGATGSGEIVKGEYLGFGAGLGVLALAGSFRLKVIAEGIETEGQAAHLLGMGCHCGQGYLFARPLAADAFEAYLADRLEERPA